MSARHTTRADLLHLVARLEALCAEIRAWADTCAAEKDRRSLVDLRRQLSEVIGDAGRAGHAEWPSESAQLMTSYRQHVSELRSRVALHQAEWPAVRLGTDDDHIAYRQSAVAVQDETAKFIKWVRAHV